MQELKKGDPQLGTEDEYVEVLKGHQEKVKGHYANDKLEGEVTYYNRDGSVDRIEIYENGELVGEK